MFVMLKEDNTTSSFYLCYLLCVHSVIITFGTICTSVPLYTIVKCTDGMAAYMGQCMLLITCVVTMVFIYMLIKLQMNILSLFVFHNIIISPFL